MRVSKVAGDFKVLCVSGTHVVMIGWDMPKDYVTDNDIVGFAIRRKRARDGEVIWLSSMKTFEAVLPNPDPGAPVSSLEHPIQSFQWCDYSVSPGESYTYTVVAMKGVPGSLEQDVSIPVKIKTENPDIGEHAVFFNRGAIASQEYARRFQNMKPSEVGQAAYDWLSRGLVESLEQFIANSQSGDRLHGAFFEFKNSRIHEALKSAKKRGVKITIIFDADSQGEGNVEAIEDSKIGSMTLPREKSGRFAHNKFIILLKNELPVEVWTGSTNLSENGLFGHSNNAHVVRAQLVAEKYEEYWQLLKQDLTRKPTSTAVSLISPVPDISSKNEIDVIFSPQENLDALDLYANLAKSASRAIFATFAFGMDERFVNVYDNQDSVIRFALMEKKGNGAKIKIQSKQIDNIRKHKNVTIAVGNKIKINAFDRWLAEISDIRDGVHVRYVHTKYMLIDPLGDEPIVIVGSANFSAASTDTNDENMLIIRGNRTVSDIYLGEYMRLFSHYAFRESLSFRGALSPAKALVRKYLIPTAKWVDGADGKKSGYFVAGSDRALRRIYFSGQ